MGLAQSNKDKFPLWAQTFLGSYLPESYIFLNSFILPEIVGYCNQLVLFQSFPYNTKFNLFFFRRSPDKSLSVLEHSITNLLFLSRATTLQYRYGDIYTASLCFYKGNTSAPTICQMTLLSTQRGTIFPSYLNKWKSRQIWLNMFLIENWKHRADSLY